MFDRDFVLKVCEAIYAFFTNFGVYTGATTWVEL